MKVLVIGGGGYVAGLTLPILSTSHSIHIFDLKPPVVPDLADLPFTQGDISDSELLATACAGQDALIYMAMGLGNWQHPQAVQSSFDSNVRGVYLALEAAHDAGISHAVYTSSMSVYDGNLRQRYFPDEEITPNSIHLYGLTKRLGEEVCRNAARRWGMTVDALRLCLPTADKKWQEEAVAGVPTITTTASDVACALAGALEYRGAGFEAFMISGDYEQKLMNMRKARRLLNWEPLARPNSGTTEFTTELR